MNKKRRPTLWIPATAFLLGMITFHPGTINAQETTNDPTSDTITETEQSHNGVTNGDVKMDKVNQNATSNDDTLAGDGHEALALNGEDDTVGKTDEVLPLTDDTDTDAPPSKTDEVDTGGTDEDLPLKEETQALQTAEGTSSNMNEDSSLTDNLNGDESEEAMVLNNAVESVVGQVISDVVEDQRIVQTILTDQNIPIEYDQDGKISNVITQELLEGVKNIQYTSPNGENEPVSLKGIKHFKNITYVRIAKSNLPAFPEDLLYLPKLHNITLNGTTFDEANPGYKPKPEPFVLPEALKNLQNLTSLHLNNNRITEIPSWITEMTQLKKINFVGSNIYTDNIFVLPENIHLLENLETLELSNNQMTTLPATFHLLPKLKTFRFVYNELDNISQENYDFIKSLKTKHVFHQIVKVIEEMPFSKDHPVNVELPQIVDFLVNQSENESDMNFTLMGYNDDFSKIISKTIIPIDELYQDGQIVLDKQYIQSGKNYRLLAKETAGLFGDSFFNYYFTTGRFIGAIIEQSTGNTLADITGESEALLSEALNQRLEALLQEGYVVADSVRDYDETTGYVVLTYYVDKEDDSSPLIPLEPSTPIETPDETMPDSVVPEEEVDSMAIDQQQALPQTGESNKLTYLLTGLFSLVSGLFLLPRKRKHL